MGTTYYVKPASCFIGGFVVCKSHGFNKDIILYSGTKADCCSKAAALNNIRRYGYA